MLGVGLGTGADDGAGAGGAGVSGTGVGFGVVLQTGAPYDRHQLEYGGNGQRNLFEPPPGG